MTATLDARPAGYPQSELDLDLRWWAAANYLTVAQIYLQSNPLLLQRPLPVDDIKPRLLGHWGTSPGLSMIYTLLNRLIRETGDGLPLRHRSRAWRTGAGGQHLPRRHLQRDLPASPAETATDLPALVRQFSTPGGVPSHVSVQTPGSIHEGGELGYALAHAAGAAFDHPDLLVACVIGDGEAETGPLAASWKLPAFLNAAPGRRGAADPAPERLQDLRPHRARPRRGDDAVCALLAAQGWDPVVVAGDDPAGRVHRPAYGLDRRSRSGSARFSTRRASCGARHPGAKHGGRRSSCAPRRAGPARTSSTASRSRAPSAPTRCPWPRCGRTPSTCGCWSSGCVLPSGRAVRRGRPPDPEVAALAPAGDKRMSATPYANGGRLLTPLDIPPLERYALDIAAPGVVSYENTRPLGELLRDVYAASTTERRTAGTSGCSAPTRPPATGSARLRGHRPLPAGARAAHRRPPVARTGG